MSTMTLADFARQIGISPELARQWKRRGKIVEVEGGFELAAFLGRDGAMAPGDPDDAKSLRGGVGLDRREAERPESSPALRSNDVTGRDGFVTLPGCPGCSALAARVEALESNHVEMREWVNNLQHDFRRRLKALETGGAGGAARDHGERMIGKLVFDPDVEPDRVVVLNPGDVEWS
jgi:hypothetical protein